MPDVSVLVTRYQHDPASRDLVLAQHPGLSLPAQTWDVASPEAEESAHVTLDLRAETVAFRRAPVTPLDHVQGKC